MKCFSLSGQCILLLSRWDGVSPLVLLLCCCYQSRVFHQKDPPANWGVPGLEGNMNTTTFLGQSPSALMICLMLDAACYGHQLGVYLPARGGLGFTFFYLLHCFPKDKQIQHPHRFQTLFSCMSSVSALGSITPGESYEKCWPYEPLDVLIILYKFLWGRMWRKIHFLRG